MSGNQYFSNVEEETFFSPIEQRSVPSIASVQPLHLSDPYDFNDFKGSSSSSGYLSPTRVRFQDSSEFRIQENRAEIPYSYTDFSTARSPTNSGTRSIIRGYYKVPSYSVIEKATSVPPVERRAARSSPIAPQSGTKQIPPVIRHYDRQTIDQSPRYSEQIPPVIRHYDRQTIDQSPRYSGQRLSYRYVAEPSSSSNYTSRYVIPETIRSSSIRPNNQSYSEVRPRSTPAANRKNRTYKSLAPSPTVPFIFRNEKYGQADDTFYHRRKHYRIPPYAEGDNPMRTKILECLADKYHVSLKKTNYSSVPDVGNWRVKPTLDLRSVIEGHRHQD